MVKTAYKSTWESYSTNITKALWQKDKIKALGSLEKMLTALHDMTEHKTFDSDLVNAFFDIADFYCFESNFIKAETIYITLLESLRKVVASNDPYIKATMERISRVLHMQRLIRLEQTGKHTNRDLDLILLTNN